MSNKYKHEDHVPTSVLCERAHELVSFITDPDKRKRMDAEFSMRIPAELDRDADLVISQIATRLVDREAELAELKRQRAP